MALGYGGQILSSCDVLRSSGATKLKDVTNPRLFVTRYPTPQLKLFALKDVLGEGGWLKALRLEEYAARTRQRPQALQQVLFSYLDALQTDS